MLWLIAIACLAVGTIIGVLAAGRLSSTSPARIKEMETQIENLHQQHGDYRSEVSNHFNTTAELVQQMTQSYRDVYQHLATGAQDLCSEDVADKMLPAGESRMFDKPADTSGAEAPKDYAAKRAPEREGALSEGFGLDQKSDRKPDTSNESDASAEPDRSDNTGSTTPGKDATNNTSSVKE